METIFEDDGEADLTDLVADQSTPAPWDLTTDHLLREPLEELLMLLPARDARILRLRFGLQDGKRRSLAEAGKSIGIGRERVRQIERESLRLLRHPSKEKSPEEYLGD